MTEIQFGWIAPLSPRNLSRQDFLAKIRAALDIVAGQFDSVWLPDHLQLRNGSFLEAWTMLTYMAAIRPELKYGHMVICQLFRNPALLAKMAATFQYMSQGHFMLGIGAGWAEEEARAYNLPFPSDGQRVEELAEQIQIIKALWQEESVTFEGKYHQVHQAICEPRPEPLPPLLVAAHQPRMMRLTARYADWWNTGVESLEEAREQLKMLDVACEKEGRDPKTLKRTAMIACCCASTEERVKDLISTYKGPGKPSIVGTPAQVAEQFHEYAAEGFDYFTIVSGDFYSDFTTIEMLAREVLPAFNAVS